MTFDLSVQLGQLVELEGDNNSGGVGEVMCS